MNFALLMFLIASVVYWLTDMNFSTASNPSTTPPPVPKKTKCPVVFHGIKKHSACLPRSQKYVSGGVTDDQQEEIVRFINIIRSRIPSCFMPKMYWGELEAITAQAWAENCQFKHDKLVLRKIPGYYFLYQSIARDYADWTETLKSWQNESNNFKYGGPNMLDDIQNYSNMIYEQTYRIGCGYADCTDFKFYVCNYGPRPPVGPSKPYKYCNNTGLGLTDCKKKVCLNDGFFKQESCECKCPDQPHLVGDTCDVNCEVKDKPPCNTKWHEWCCAYVFVPANCPWMCNACPYIQQYQRLLAGSTQSVYENSITAMLILMALSQWLI